MVITAGYDQEAGERGAQRIIDEAAGTPVRATVLSTDPLDSRLALTTWSRET